MRAAWIIGSVIVATASVARADYDSEWRDGCPPGNLEQVADYIAYSRAYGHDGSQSVYSTDADQIGPTADLDSALVPTRVMAQGQYDHFSFGNDGNGRARLLGTTVQAHLNFPGINFNPLVPIGTWRFAASLNLAALQMMSGDGLGSSAAPGQWGNIVLAPALRHTWMTSYIHHKRKPRDPITDLDGDITALRHAVAFQGLVTASPETYDVNETMLLWKRSAFDSALFSPHRTWGGSFEYRTEGVGCYSPFFHLRLAALWTSDLAGERLMIFPETVTVGMSAAAHTSVYFQYGAVVTIGSSDENLSPVFGANVIHRFRFGVDWSFAHVSVGAHLDEFRGSFAYDGTVLGVYVGVKPAAKGDWE